MKFLNRFNRCRILFLLLFFVGCTHKPTESLPKLLFPDGKYQQSVQLQLLQPRKQTIPFISLSKVDKGFFKIIGLTPFGTKAFEAQGNTNKPGTTQVKFHMELPPKIRPEFVKQTLRKIQTLNYLKRSHLNVMPTHDEFKDKNLVLRIYKYNAEGIPLSFTISDNGWKAFIETSKYTPIK